MVDVYIKYKDGNYYKLDIDPKEVINIKTVVKDLNDITKIFAPFTQSFKIKATNKNKLLCGFIGNEKNLKWNDSNDFDAMVYISNFIFESGKLTFTEIDYELQRETDFTTTFASNLTGLVETLGDATIQDVFDLTDPLTNITWDGFTLKQGLESIKTVTLANGIELKYGIPFISNNRTWQYSESLSLVDNIQFNPNRNIFLNNGINLKEIRPAINYMAIMNSIIDKYSLNVNAPIFSKPELTDLMVFCNSESLTIPNTPAFPLTNFTDLVYSRFDVKDDAGGNGIPAVSKWLVTSTPATGIFKIKRRAVSRPNNWGDGIDVILTFNNLIAKDANTPKIRVVLKKQSGEVLDSQEIENSEYKFRVKDTQLDGAGELFYKFEILPLTLLTWDNITANTLQYYRYEYKYFTVKSVERATYQFICTTFILSEDLGGNKINLISSLPKMKCIDFLRSFFKTFNISVISTGLQDNSMYWVTPLEIKEINKPYSKRIVDFTKYFDYKTVNKKPSTKYNQYSFTHATSKYFDSIYGDGTVFGSLKYPLLPPSKPTKFEVKTEYSILKQTDSFTHQNIRTCLAFEKSTPTVLDNGGNLYKSVFDEFTIFYLKNKSLGTQTVGCEYSEGSNAEVLSLLEANFVNYNNGKSLAFGAENEITDSLYANYYKDFIERLLNQNTYVSEMIFNLPPNEIFLNFSNTAQNESEIPTGFRPQNEIVVGSQRYSLIDSVINTNSGKAKLTLMNF